MKQNFVLQRDLRKKQQLAENISPYKQQTIAVIWVKIEENAHMVKHVALQTGTVTKRPRDLHILLCSLAN